MLGMATPWMRRGMLARAPQAQAVLSLSSAPRRLPVQAAVADARQSCEIVFKTVKKAREVVPADAAVMSCCEALSEATVAGEIETERAQLSALNQQRDALLKQLQGVEAAAAAAEQKLALHLQHLKGVADVSQLLGGLSSAVTSRDLRYMVEQTSACAAAELTGQEPWQFVTSMDSVYYQHESITTAQLWLVASCLKYRRLVSACEQHLKSQLETAGDEDVRALLRLATNTEAAPALEALRGLLCIWMQDNIATGRAHKVLQEFASHMNFAVEDPKGRVFQLSSPAACYEQYGYASGFVVSAGLDWLCTAARTHAACSAFMLPAFITGFNRYASFYRSKTYAPGSGFSSEPASYANCILLPESDPSAALSEQRLANAFMACLENATHGLQDGNKVGDLELSTLIDRSLPQAWEMASWREPPRTPATMASSEGFLRLASWLLNPSDTRLPHPSGSFWPSQSKWASVNIPFAQDEELAELFVRFYPVNSEKDNVRTRQLFSGLLDSARIAHIVDRLTTHPAVKDIFVRILSTRTDITLSA